MGMIRVGQTQIPYELRRSSVLSERRITVTPGLVEVVVRTTDDDNTIEEFLTRKRQWVFTAVKELENATAKRPVVPRFMTGSKIPFRGRMMTLIVRRHDGPHIEIGYRHGFIVDLPSWVQFECPDSIIANELKLWLKRRIRRDVQEIAANYQNRFGLKARAIRVTDMKSGWGSCGAEGTIHINWTLVFAPKQVLEYVIVHELAHLRYRSHGEVFWSFLRSLMPGFEKPQAWLERHQASLDAGFLTV